MPTNRPKELTYSPVRRLLPTVALYSLWTWMSFCTAQGQLELMEGGR